VVSGRTDMDFPDSNAAWAAPEMKLRLDISAQIASRLAATSTPAISLQLAPPMRPRRNAAHHRCLRNPAAGAGAFIDVAGIPEEMTMDCRAKPDIIGNIADGALLLADASFAAWATCRNSRAPPTDATRG